MGLDFSKGPMCTYGDGTHYGEIIRLINPNDYKLMDSPSFSKNQVPRYLRFSKETRSSQYQVSTGYTNGLLVNHECLDEKVFTSFDESMKYWIESIKKYNTTKIKVSYMKISVDGWTSNMIDVTDIYKKLLDVDGLSYDKEYLGNRYIDKYGYHAVSFRFTRNIYDQMVDSVIYVLDGDTLVYKMLLDDEYSFKKAKDLGLKIKALPDNWKERAKYYDCEDIIY